MGRTQKNLVILIGTVIAVYLGMKYLLPLFVPFFFAYFFAWILRPIVSLCHRKLKIPLVVGATIGVILLASSFLVVIFFLGRLLFSQIILLLKNVPVYGEMLASMIERIAIACDKLFKLEPGTVGKMTEEAFTSMISYIQNEILPKMTEQTVKIAISIAAILTLFLIVLIATVLFLKDMEEYKAGIRKSEFYPAVHKVTKKLSDTGIAYMKTQLIIMSVIASILTVAFTILKNPYALLIGLLVGTVDAFPVLGSGLILVPWTVIMLLERDFFSAAVIMTGFVLCQIVREILEPRLLGNRIGIPPIYDMMAMYVGVQLFGILGFFLGPLSLVIIRTILQENWQKKIQKEELGDTGS